MSRHAKPRDPPNEPTWNPPRHAVWRWRSTETDADRPGTLLVHHPLVPFDSVLDDASQAALQRMAHTYLVTALQLDAVAAPYAVDLRAWVEALAPDTDDPLFGWMPLASGDSVREPLGSFRFASSAGDQVVALFASQRIGKDDFIGSGFGLRVVLALSAHGGGFEATITSLAASLPFGVYLSSPVGVGTIEANGGRRLLDISKDLRPDIALTTGLDAETLCLRAVRLAEKPAGGLLVERHVVGYPARAPKAAEARSRVAWAFTLVGDAKSAGALAHRSALVTDMAAGDASVYKFDAASQRPDTPRAVGVRRDAAILDPLPNPLRSDETITGTLLAPLERSPEVAVWPSRFARGDRPLLPPTPPAPRKVYLPGSGKPDIRSDDASAVQAFRHVRELLDRLDAYGMPALLYFRTAQAKINVFYRSGVSPGPGKDGRTVNARVLPEGWPATFNGSLKPEERPALQLHLGWADLMRRERAKWNAATGPSAAVPLGLASDARWMWHEFGHLLLMATTGELELRFAHSPGDGLAAIVGDPLSRLCEQSPRWRFATFPWVMLPRRHDRCVLRGWSWSGTLHAALARVPAAKHPCRKGYLSEQILSSTLFRLYRCLGGDTCLAGNPNQPDTVERQRASHYAVWLIVRALTLLGDARVLPAHVPETLALAMMEADTTLKTPWDVQFPIGSGPHYKRSGGCAHKAIRWAFEAQGLYVPAGADGNAPGAPPAVDVFIASARAESEATPYGDVPYGPGNYMPVSLHWQDSATDPMPEWQANANALVVNSDGSILVEAGNRGSQTAEGVTVQAWWAPWPANTPPPKWPDAALWRACTPQASAPQDIAPAQHASFGPFQHTRPAGRYVVLAQARCEADRANIEPATLLACSLQPTLLADLVANDNNLGLRLKD